MQTRRFIAALLAWAWAAVHAASPLPFPNLQLGDASGEIRAIAPLPDGGVLIGGSFDRVNGLVRKGIARLNADGSFNAAWGADFDGFVNAIVVAGPTVYIGGNFQPVNGPPRQGLAALSLADGSITSWAASADGVVYSLAVDAGDLIVGGTFATIAGVPRKSLARVDLSTGAVRAWQNDVTWNSFPGTVTSLAIDGTWLYVGGQYDLIGGQPRTNLGRVSPATSNSTDPGWNPSPSDPIADIAVNGPWVYVSGSFLAIGGTYRQYLARVSYISGAVDPGWSPLVLSPPRGLALTGTTLIVGATLYSNPAEPYVPPNRLGIGEVDLSIGAMTSWNPTDGLSVFPSSLTIANGYLFAGAQYARNGGTSSVLRWVLHDVLDSGYAVFAGNNEPSVSAIVHAADGTTYIGGNFQGIDGLPIANLARTKPDGTLDTGWHPQPNFPVEAMVLKGDDLFVGGTFTRLGTVPRNYLANIATDATGTVDPAWNPNPGGNVTHLATDGTDLFAAGRFWNVSDSARVAIAKIASTGVGAVDPGWDAGWEGNPEVRALAADSTGVFAGGVFLATDTGQQNLVKLSPATGARDTGWTPVPNSDVEDLKLADGSLFVAGRFQQIGSVVQRFVAKVDSATGSVDASWMPQFSDVVGAIGQRGDILYVGSSNVNGRTSLGANIAVSTATGRPDYAWYAGVAFPEVFAPRAGQVWLGVDGITGGRRGVAAYPEPACTGIANDTPCDGGPGVAGATCQSSVCTPPLAQTSTVLAESPNPASQGQPVTLTATVSSSAAPATGFVHFFRNGFEEGSALVSGGVATLSSSAIAPFADYVAIYQGSAQHLPSRSAAVHVEVLVSLKSVKSRKSHAGGWSFDVDIDPAIDIEGPVSVEPRIGDHLLVFEFDGPVTIAGNATCVDRFGAPVGSVSAQVSPESDREVFVSVGGLPISQRAKVSLSNVNGNGANASASLVFLLGDVDGSRSVTASDILRIKGRQGPVDDTTILYDLDLSGGVSPGDINAAKAASGLAS